MDREYKMHVEIRITYRKQLQNFFPYLNSILLLHTFNAYFLNGEYICFYGIFFLLLYLYSCSGFSIHRTSLYFSYPQIFLNEIHQKIHNFCNKISTFKQIKKLCYPNDYIMYYGLIMDEILVSEIYKHVRLLAV